MKVVAVALAGAAAFTFGALVATSVITYWAIYDTASKFRQADL